MREAPARQVPIPQTQPERATPWRAQSWRERFATLRTKARKAIPFASGALGALVMLLLYGLLSPAQPVMTPRDVNEAIAVAMASATPPPAYGVRVRQIIQPSLVVVQTTGPDDASDKDDGLGSGVVVNDMGDILTSLHVVADAVTIQVTFGDGTQSAAEVINAQPENDIAVLRALTPPAQVVPATLGNPGGARVGDEAYVVGHPLGLYGSLSSGVISGLDRTYKGKEGEAEMKGLIQIDAAVNPGNSGGPLMNRNGEVIGIVTALVNPSGQESFSGIGFAVPINVAGGAAGMPQY